MSIAIVLMVLLASIFTCHYLAGKRGANPVFWGVMGAVFGPLAIPFIFFAKFDVGSDNHSE